jgi:dTDP-4-amino-4,6-dideoxygalactose transaminase
MAESAAESTIAVPFVDLGPSHRPLANELLEDFAQLIEAGSFVNGPQVVEFEEAFARYCGVDHCVGVASGLDALRLALLAADIEPGDEVLVPANTFIATFEAITQAGGVPIPVDASYADYNMDPGCASDAVSSRTRFMLPVHLYGQMADVKALADVAAAHRLVTVEDACQAHGARRDGIRAGAAGDAAAFSFYPGKNLGAMGDAGAMVTNSPQMAEGVRALREHGQIAKYAHVREGWTARLDTMQAIVLLHKLPYLDEWNGERKVAAAAYAEMLQDVGDLELLPVPAGSEPVWHLFLVRTQRRDALAEHLRERGIATGMHYPEPPHLSRAYASLGYGPGSFPVSESLAKELLSLPIYPGISELQVEAVGDAVIAFFERD